MDRDFSRGSVQVRTWAFGSSWPLSVMCWCIWMDGCHQDGWRQLEDAASLSERLCTHLSIPRRGTQLYPSKRYHRSLALVTGDRFVPAVVVDFRGAGTLEMQCGPQGGLLAVTLGRSTWPGAVPALSHAFLTWSVYLPCNHSLLFMQQQQQQQRCPARRDRLWQGVLQRLRPSCLWPACPSRICLTSAQ